MEISPRETVAMPAQGWVYEAVKGKAAMNVDGEVEEEAIRLETAAVEVQRMYRGHRVRRNLADAATMAHKFGWWNVVEGAVLQHNSSNFYAYNAPQNATQRWLRLKKKAAKVGKGLSKNEKARKLALQHWLEAIDPKHRYGHNLHFYYEVWSCSHTQEPFFYWLDIGEGKNSDLEKCKRSKLQKELIKYLSPSERQWFEVVIQDGKLLNKMTREPVNTPKGDKWIFVMSTTGKLYVGKKEKGKLQHSSFLAGGATTAAGRILVKDGTIELMEAHSGHYHPTQENFDELIRILRSSGADLTLARVQAFSDDMLSVKSNSTKSLGSKSGKSDLYSPVVSEDMQKADFNKKSASICELESLNLHDEQLADSLVDEVTLVEKSLCEEAQDKDHVVIEGLEFLQTANSFDDSCMLENLEGMKVEIIKPGTASELENGTRDELQGNTSGQDSTAKASSKVPSSSASSHQLFTPASQTFSKLEDRAECCSADWQGVKMEDTAQLTPDSKVYLLRRLSFSRPVVTPS
ncbi:unnamed protein product [Calypogeia fissa]